MSGHAIIGSMKSKKKRPRDPNELAASIVADATGETPQEQPADAKNPAAVELGRLGGLKGGKARANKLSPSARKRIARKAAQARWAKKRKSSK